MENKRFSYWSALRYEDLSHYEEDTGSGDILKGSERILRYFLWAYKQLLNIRTKQQIVVLGCKSLHKAAAAHVNNNTVVLGCRTSSGDSWKR